MKTTIILAITLALFASVFTSQINDHLDAMKIRGESTKEIFKAYHHLHEKEYQLNSQEGLKRYRTFKENVKWIEQENAKRGEEIYGITQFSDLTEEEYNATLMSPEHFQKGIDEMNQNSESVNFLENADTIDLEEETQSGADPYNWMDFDGPMKNQRSCGSCWAFAALAAVENIYHRMKKKYTPFSEQYLVDCDNYDKGCNGGYPTNTFNWLRQNGIVHQDVLKYTGRQAQCDRNLKKYEYKIINGFNHFSRRPTSFREYIKQGAAVIGIYASGRGFGLYRPKGAFSAMNLGNCGRKNHAVTIVGLIKENGKEYAIGRNSWGTNWGYKGYFKLPYESHKNCYVLEMAWVPWVYDGKVPSNHAPKPAPRPTNCVDLYGDKGFDSKPLYTKVCDSQLAFRPNLVSGIKYPEKIATPYPLNVRFFRHEQCFEIPYEGESNVVVEHTTDNLERDGRSFQAASMAMEKPAKDGCVEFYTRPCLQGDVLFSICNDIRDNQLVNISELKRVRSFSGDPEKIKKN